MTTVILFVCKSIWHISVPVWLWCFVIFYDICRLEI